MLSSLAENGKKGFSLLFSSPTPATAEGFLMLFSLDQRNRRWLKGFSTLRASALPTIHSPRQRLAFNSSDDDTTETAGGKKSFLASQININVEGNFSSKSSGRKETFFCVPTGRP